MSELSGDLIRYQLPTYTFGQHVIYTDQIGSTNTELKKYAQMGAPEGTLYITDEQIGGRGRLKRIWKAPPGTSLLMSLLFRPTFLAAGQIQQLMMICSLAMIDSLKKHAGLAPGLKWPNDLVWVDGRKIAGILTEAEFEKDQIKWVVVGMGLNVNLDFSRETHPESASNHPPLAKTAVSLSMLLEKDTGHLRLPILQSYLQHVEQRYEALKQGVSPHFEWQRKLIGLGKEVTVRVLSEEKSCQGIIVGVNENGALRLRQEDDTFTDIMAGDVTLRE